MKKNRIYFALSIFIFLFSIYYNFLGNKHSEKRESYSIYIDSLKQPSTAVLVSELNSKLEKPLLLTDNSETPDMMIKNYSSINEKDLEKFDVVEISDDYIVPIVNIKNSMDSIDTSRIMDKSNSEITLATSSALNYFQKNKEFENDIFKINKDLVTISVSRDPNLIGFVFASEYFADGKIKPIKLEGKKVDDKNYPFKDKLYLLINKDFEGNSSVKQILSEVKFGLSLQSIKY